MVRIVIFVIIGVLTAYALFLYLTYIDIEINEGKYEDFEIGMIKEDVYKLAVSRYTENKVYMIYPVNENNVGPLVVFDPELVSYAYLVNLDSWSFYFKDNYHDVIKLSFNGDNLIKIYRHRKYFELP